MHQQSYKSQTALTQGTMGTFAGVFTPSILTILGIILFMRLGYVVGNAGLGRALIIIGLANTISVLTTFSLSAIATNLKIKGGGDYYLISRTLGVEFGGAIGIVLFLAQSVSIAFYCIGFGEAFNGMLNTNLQYFPQIIAIIAVSFLFVFAWLGTDWATKFQYVVMSILVLALISFFIGGIMKWDQTLLFQNFATPAAAPKFWFIFAIFFPAVTGFTQGVSMSGDLKDPGKSLPLGTFIAVGISMLIYFLAAIVFAASIPQNILIKEPGSMQQIASLEFLINAGVIAATLSSAMASFLGAPRILQSIAKDKIFEFLVPFAKGAGPNANPRRGVLLAAAIAFVTISLGKLNLIAAVVSMFFLISYGLLNYATFFEARSASPSFRPRFRWYNYRISLLGFLACLIAMLAINLAAGALALAVLYAIYQYLKRSDVQVRWADSRRSYHLQRLREHLLATANELEHPRDWRPQILAFSDDAHRREGLLRFSSWLEGGSGMTSVVSILEGEGIKMLKLKDEADAELKAHILELEQHAFPLVIVAPDAPAAIHTLVQGFGIGPLKVNTVLLNWIEHFPKGFLGFKELRYGKNLRTAFRLGCNLVVLDAKDEEWAALSCVPSEKRRIDVWWWCDASSRLMILLAYMVTRSSEWSEATIRMCAACYKDSSQEIVDNIKNMLAEIRIDASFEIIQDVRVEKIIEYSADASLVFLPFRLKGTQLVAPFGDEFEELLERLPIAALVLAAEDIDLEAEPEEGKIAEAAFAYDLLTEADKKAQDAVREAQDTARKAQENIEALQQAKESGADAQILKKAETEVFQAQQNATRASRKAAKALAKAQEATSIAKDLGVKQPLIKSEKEKVEPTTSEDSASDHTSHKDD